MTTKKHGNPTVRSSLHDKVYALRKDKGLSWEGVFTILEKNGGVKTVQERSAIRSGYYYRVRKASKKGSVKKAFASLSTAEKEKVFNKYNRARHGMRYTPSACHGVVAASFGERIELPGVQELSRLSDGYRKTGSTSANGANGATRLIMPNGVSISFEGPRDGVLQAIGRLL